MNLSAALFLSASLLSPLKHLVPVSKPAVPDQRVRFLIHNNTFTNFADLKIDGRTYTVLAHHDLIIKAPAGTMVYAASRFDNFHPGDPVLTVTASLQESRFDLR